MKIENVLSDSIRRLIVMLAVILVAAFSGKLGISDAVVLGLLSAASAYVLAGNAKAALIEHAAIKAGVGDDALDAGVVAPPVGDHVVVAPKLALVAPEPVQASVNAVVEVPVAPNPVVPVPAVIAIAPVPVPPGMHIDDL